MLSTVARCAPSANTAPPAGPALLVHRIPDSVSEANIAAMIEAQCKVTAVTVEPIARQPGTVATGKAKVLFASQAHADLAFNSLSVSTHY